MAESATAAAPAAPATTVAPAAPSAPAAPAAAPSAGSHLSSVPAGPEWASSFKNEEVKTLVSQKGFKTAEDLAISYQNLEKKMGIPEDRLLKLPEKMDGPEARAVWEKLGVPKEAKEYGLPRVENGDNSFTDFAETAFHKIGIPKAQALELAKSYNEFGTNMIKAQSQARAQAITQGDEALKKEWGAQYETNVGIVKQGVKVLGLDAKTLDLMEMGLGREALYKNLQKIGVSVGESEFIAGGTAPGSTTETVETAQEKIKQLQGDRKFGKKLGRGDVEAKKEWDRLHKIAFPGNQGI